MRPRFIAAFIALSGTPFLFFAAHAEGVVTDEADALLWRDGTARSKPLSQKEFADAASQEISLLKELRSWRESLRQSGAKKRDVAGTNLLGYSAGISLGASAPAQSGLSTSGLAAYWGNVEIGSTLRAREMESALRTFDGALAGQKPGVTEPIRAQWLRAKPIETSGGFLELSATQGARDMKNGEGESWRRGEFLGAKTQLQLPANWLASGEWTRAQIEENEAKDSWRTELKGPLAHPFGVAKAEIALGQTEAGFENLTTQNAAGARNGSAALTQAVALGPLGGQLHFDAQNARRDEMETALEGETLREKKARTEADLKLRVTPNLSLKASGRASVSQRDEADELAIARQESQVLGGDLGLEWRFSRSLRVGASAGATQIENWRRAGEETALWQDLPSSEEERATLELRHQTGGGALGVQYVRREREGLTEAWRELETLRLEAERRLIGTFRVRTLFDFARDRNGLWNDEKALARSAQAQFSLSRAARLDLQLRDGAALPSSIAGDPLANPFGALSSSLFQTGDRQFAARLGAGSATGSKGLGLAFEYARHARVGEDLDSWKVGLTFR